jgi:hypothetical protein
MVFDIRGRRKRVVQVAYAVLAFLMAASLFTVVGPLNVGDIFGGGGSSNPASALDDQAQKIEQRLRRNPNDEELLLALVRIRYSAGNASVQVDPSTQQSLITTEARKEYEQAAAAWDKYLKQEPADPSPNTAQQAANALFTLAQTATTGAEAEANLKDAAEAQGIVATARPSVGTLSTFAYYSYFALDFEQGDKAARQAEAKAASTQERKSIHTQLTQIRKQAKKFAAQQKASAAKGSKKQAQQELGSPLGGLSGGGLAPPAAP